jgi:hypothetical protein
MFQIEVEKKIKTRIYVQKLLFPENNFINSVQIISSEEKWKTDMFR